MKKIGVLTFHSAENSGAVLQCWALQTALKKLGADPFVIDYQPSYIQKQYQVLLNPFSEAQLRGGTGLGYAKSVLAFALQDILFYRKLSRKRKFRNFRHDHLTLSRRYDSCRQLVDAPPEADAYITGSDQLWCPFLTGGDYDPAFFLRFGNVPKYAYAISLGKAPSEEETRQIAALASDFSAISFREAEMCQRLAPFLGVSRVGHHVDPTLLLDGKDWMEFVRPHDSPRPYLLVYALERNPAFAAAVQEIRKDRALDLVDISQCNLRLPGTSSRRLGFSPDEFLSLVANAELVLTNSFHCTVFSVVFRKSFLVVPHTRTNSRIAGLLDALGLENHLWEETRDVHPPSKDWNSVEDKIARYRESSLEYLRRIVGNG